MFVEQLTPADLIEYVTNYELNIYDDYVKQQYDFNAISDYKIQKDQISFKINDKKLYFTDFDYTTNATIKLRVGTHNKRWLNFMSKKFGNPYKIAFLKFREQERKQVVAETLMQFDEDTKKYSEEMVSNTQTIDDILKSFIQSSKADQVKEPEDDLIL